MSGDEDTLEPQQKKAGSVEPEVVGSEAIENEAEHEAIEIGVEQLLDEIEDDALSAEVLAEQLEEAGNKARENRDKLLRIQAEMENLRRRTEKELQNAHKYALTNFSKELLPVIDSVELAVRAAAGDAPEIAKIREGNELILQQFFAVLGKFDIVVLDPVGEAFNPERHQAMSIQPTADVKPNTVVQVFQKGYLLNDRLLRPAMVVVAQAETKQTEIDQRA